MNTTGPQPFQYIFEGKKRLEEAIFRAQNRQPSEEKLAGKRTLDAAQAETRATGKTHFRMTFRYRAASGGTLGGLRRSFVACS